MGHRRPRRPHHALHQRPLAPARSRALSQAETPEPRNSHRRHSHRQRLIPHARSQHQSSPLRLNSYLDGTAVWVSGPLPGKTHDAKAFKETGAADILTKAGGGFGDKGYQGTGLVTPKKKPKGGELTLSDKEYNSQVSSFRAPVERIIAHFKNWKMLHTDYRRPYATYHDAFDAARALFFFSITWGFE
jgi:hypothetical protein